MGSPTIVLLLDMDNTLLDNDRGTADLKHHLKRERRPRSGAIVLGYLRAVTN